jgi:hypothetical protein
MYKIGRFIKRYFIWLSLCLALIFSIFYGFALRSNHIHMTELKYQVIEFDHDTNFRSMGESLVELRRFVSSHAVPNFSEDPATGRLRLFWGTGTFYLQHSYRRAALEVMEAAENELANQIDSNVHAEVRDICDRQFAHFSQAYADCFVRELDYRLSDFNMPEIVLPDPSLFHLSYASSPVALDWATFLGLMALSLFVAFFTTLCTSVIRSFLPKNSK